MHYRIKLTKLVAALSLIVMCCAGSALAQMDPGSGIPVPKAAKSPDENSRPKQAATTDKTADTGSKPAASRSDTGTRAARKSEATPTEAAGDVTTDPVKTLRGQIDVEPNAQERVRLQLKLVEQLVATGKKADALSQLRLMAAEDRFDPPSFYNIGNALARLGDSDAAVISYSKAIEQRKGRYSRALNNLGVVLMRQGHWQEANESFTSALKLESFRYAEASYNLGRLYAAQGEIDLAIREWRRALKVDPDHRAAAEAIAGANGDGRIMVSSRAESETFDAKRSVASSDRASNPARSSSSMQVLRVDQVTYNLLQHARDARDRGKDREAVDNYRSVISRMGGYFGPANLELSYVLIGMKQPNEALGYLRAITARDAARYPISFYHMGRIYEIRGELDLAAKAYEQAATRYRGVNPQFLLDISRVREKRGDYKGALTAMEQYLNDVEKQGVKPDWSVERLATLRQKLSEQQKQ